MIMTFKKSFESLKLALDNAIKNNIKKPKTNNIRGLLVRLDITSLTPELINQIPIAKNTINVSF